MAAALFLLWLFALVLHPVLLVFQAGAAAAGGLNLVLSEPVIQGEAGNLSFAFLRETKVHVLVSG